MTTELTVREARESDLGFLVWVMRQAATSHLSACVWDVLLGRGSEATDAVLSRVARSDDPHWCHVSRFRVAERDGRAVGALSVFPTATEGADAFECALAAEVMGLGLPESDLLAVLERGAVLRDAVPAEHPGTVGIENVAVLPGHRGSGVVDALFDDALALGRARGHEQAQILCLVGNDRAQRAWERQGFRVSADYRNDRDDDLYGCPGAKLLVREL